MVTAAAILLSWRLYAPAGLPALSASQADASSSILLSNEAAALIKANNYQLAIQKLEQAIKLDPNNSKARENLAVAYSNYGITLQNSPKEAIKQFHRALFYDPQNRKVQANLEGMLRYVGRDPDSFKDRVSLANEARKGLDFEGAMVEFQAALRLKDDVAVHINLGDVYRVRDMNAQAIEQYKSATSSADSAQLELKLGQAYHATGDLPNAIAAYGRAIQFKPDNPDVLDALIAGWGDALKVAPLAPENHIGLGQAYQYKEDFTQAKVEYEEAKRLSKGAPIEQLAQRLIDGLPAAQEEAAAKKYINEGVDLQNRGMLDQAIEKYKQAIAFDAGNAISWVNLGSAYQARKAYDKAIDAYNKALRIDPKNVDAQQGLRAATDIKHDQLLISETAAAADLFKLGKYGEAIEKYRLLLTLAPSDPAVHFNLGATYQAKNELDSAINEYQEAIKLDQKNAQYLKALNDAYKKKADPIIAEATRRHKERDYTSAIDMYKQAIVLLPVNAALWYNLAGAYYSSQQYNDAREAFKRVLELDQKGQSDCIYMMAVIDEHYGRGAEALEGYRQYSSSAPNGKFAGAAKDRIRALMANIKDTIKIKSESEIATMKEAEDDYQKAVQLQKQKRLDEAAGLYQRAKALVPTNPDYVYALGTLFQERGEIDPATDCYKQAVDLAPGNKDFAKALQRAYLLKADRLAEKAVKEQTSGDVTAALEDYQAALKYNPADSIIWTNYGTALQQTDAFSDARTAYEKAYKLDAKNHADNVFLMAAIDEHLGKGQVALQEYQSYLSSAPTNAQYLQEAKTRVGALTRDVAGTRKLTTSTERMNAQHAADDFSQALKLQQDKKYDEAIALYQKAVDLVPKEASYQFALGTVYQAKNDYGSAVIWYHKALDISPNEAAYWYSLGTAYQAKSDLDNAISAYGKASQLSPREPSYKQCLKRCRQTKAAPVVDSAYKKQTTRKDDGTFDVTGAIADYEAALLIDDDAGTRSNLGTAFQADNQIPKAIAEYKKALQMDPKQYNAHYYLGTCYQHIKQLPLAIDEYKTYLQYAPTGQYAMDAREQIKTLARK